MRADAAAVFDDADGDLQELQAQRVELGPGQSMAFGDCGPHAGLDGRHAEAGNVELVLVGPSLDGGVLVEVDAVHAAAGVCEGTGETDADRGLADAPSRTR